MKRLTLGDFEGHSYNDLVECICKDYEVDPHRVRCFDILIAYTGGDCSDEKSWFLLRKRTSGILYENDSFHCSYYGFEGQWKPVVSSLAYLQSDKFGVSVYNAEVMAQIKDYIKRMRR